MREAFVDDKEEEEDAAVPDALTLPLDVVDFKPAVAALVGVVAADELDAIGVAVFPVLALTFIAGN
jgi:hypothetical protein